MKKGISLNKILNAGIFILLGILLFNSFFVFSIESKLNSRIEEAKELARPAELGLVIIESSCSDCFDITSITEVLKGSAEINIAKEKSLPRTSENAVKIISQYGIEKLPAIILTGEIEKASIQNFKQVDDVLLFDGVMPPYEDASTRKVVGKVSSIIINDKNCEDCADFGLLLQSFKQNGVAISKEEEFDFSESKAKDLIGKHGIEKLPAIILSEDIGAYPEIIQGLSQMGSKKNGYYVIESQAPYVEAETGKLRGLAKLTFLNDSSCKECYDVNIHKSIISRFGIVIDAENEIDISSSEGRQLISKYAIKNVPTIVLTGDLGIYENFNLVWKNVGAVEDDGAYVFREMSAMGRGIVYKDIETNEVKGLEPAVTQTEQQG